MASGLQSLSTAGGVLAVVFWSSSVCVCGSLIPKLGVFTSAGLVYLLSGALAASSMALRGKLGAFKTVSPKRAVLCGLPFVLYIVLFYLATGMAKSGRLLVVVGLLNYLWPAMALLFSIPLRGCKANWLLLPAGILASFGGALLASCSFSGSFDLGGAFSDFLSAPAPCLMAFGGAALWAVYCNMTRILDAESSSADVPLFMLASGLLLLPLGVFLREAQAWDFMTLLVLAATVLFPGFLSCVLWDAAARKGDFVFVSAFACFAPLLSTLLTGLVFKVPLGAGVWTACLLAAGGAFLCKLAVSEAAKGS